SLQAAEAASAKRLAAAQEVALAETVAAEAAAAAAAVAAETAAAVAEEAAVAAEAAKAEAAAAMAATTTEYSTAATAAVNGSTASTPPRELTLETLEPLQEAPVEEEGPESWFFGLGLTAQEFVALHRYSGLRALYPINAPRSSVLYLLFEDPVLRVPARPPQQKRHAGPFTSGFAASFGLFGRGDEAPQRSAASSAEVAEAGEAPRYVFDELYGCLFALLPVWTPRLAKRVAVAAAVAAVPALALLPQLRMGLQSRLPPGALSAALGGFGGVAGAVEFRLQPMFGLDTLTYSALVLAVMTVGSLLRTARLFRRSPLRTALMSFAAGLFSDVMFEVLWIKLANPLLEHIVFEHILSWHVRYALSLFAVLGWIGVMRVLALTRAILTLAACLGTLRPLLRPLRRLQRRNWGPDGNRDWQDRGPDPRLEAADGSWADLF
ncbi:unnamed protein product, partial [Phaeothamnion confervicola]